MIANIPLTTEASQTFISQLGDVKYVLDIKYNDRSGVWTLDLSEEVSGKILFQGAPLVLGQDVLDPFNYGIGSLTVVDGSSQLKDATTDDLGIRIMLYYISPDEVIA